MPASRLSIPQYAMALAHVASLRSEDPYRKVGAAAIDFDNRVIGTAYNDTLTGGADPDMLQGEAGNDVLVGGWNNNDTLFGGSGNDTLSGSANMAVQTDYMAGDDGDDVKHELDRPAHSMARVHLALDRRRLIHREA